MPVRRLRPTRPLDLARTLAPLRHGPYDPTILLGATGAWRATLTPEGPATLRLGWDGVVLRADAWGPGAAWTLDRVPQLVGETDDPGELHPQHRLLVEVIRRVPGLRLPRTERVVEALVPAVLEQKVTGLEAQRVQRRLVRAYGEPAPAAPEMPVGLRVPPDPAVLAALPYHAYHPFGLERRRAEVLIRIGALRRRLEAVIGMSREAAWARLLAVPGVGRWTAAEALRTALGDPDAVSIGDYHLPRLVCWALAGEPAGDDARMLELLEPYRGQRARVVRLLEVGGASPPRRAPRMAVRAIERI